MTGRIAALAIVISAAVAGIAMYYLQVYGYYQELEPQIGYQVATPDGGTARLDIADFRGIDSDSSPLRYRACFQIVGALPEMVDRPHSEPLNAPGWFDCFDAERIGEDIVAGRARAVMVEQDAPWGFDRVMALYPDGRAYVWPQINHCGEKVFDGQPAPADCPPQPQR
ncbi:MAG: histidine kinase [Rhodobacteraceae bacterium]|nr:histidine kinase [Paracoccaceae bacterium]